MEVPQGFSIHDNLEVKDDRISQLPEDILSFIISHLELKEAFRTSILSKRWKNVPLSMPALTFPCIHKLDAHGLVWDVNVIDRLAWNMTVIDHVLHLYSRGDLKISSFKMQLCSTELYPVYKSWIKTVAKLGVKHIDLDFYQCIPTTNQPSSFPLALISEAAPNLEHLSLSKCDLVPSCEFKSLKSLNLESVRLCNGELPVILASCYNLESFVIMACELSEILIIKASDQLKIMLMKLCHGSKKIRISAASLIRFEHDYSLPLESVQLNIPKVKRLHLDGDFSMPHLAKDSPLLERFSFQTTIDKLNFIDLDKNMFGNLKQLYLVFLLEFESDLLKVTSILESCPVLEKFHMGVARKEEPPSDENLRMEWIYQETLPDTNQDFNTQVYHLCPSPVGDPLPKIFNRMFQTVRSHFNKDKTEAKPIGHHRHLKEVRFGGFWGIKNEIEVALFVLKRAIVLEQLVISGNYKTYRDGGFEWDHHGVAINQRVRKMINRKLNGQTISPKAKVIFEEPAYVIDYIKYQRSIRRPPLSKAVKENAIKLLPFATKVKENAIKVLPFAACFAVCIGATVLLFRKSASNCQARSSPPSPPSLPSPPSPPSPPSSPKGQPTYTFESTWGPFPFKITHNIYFK